MNLSVGDLQETRGVQNKKEGAGPADSSGSALKPLPPDAGQGRQVKWNHL